MVSFFTLNALCITILCMVLINVFKSTDKLVEKVMFSAFISSAILYCIGDIAWGVTTMTLHYLLTEDIAYMVNMFHYYFMSIVAFMWFLFSEKELKSNFIKSAGRIVLTSIPMMIYTLLVILSYKYELIFKYDMNQSNFEHGNLFIAHIAVCFGYLITASAHSFICSKKKENYSNKQWYTSLGLFPIFPCFMAILQMCTRNASFVGVGITLSALQMYVESREQLISLDPMTRLNNKNQLFRYLENKIKSKPDNKDIYIFMMDIDRFKHINDTYGHLEGDDAIMIVSEAIYSLVNKTNHFACRYGGDEFIVACEVPKDFEPEDFINQFQKILDEVKQNREKIYEIKVSVGYSKYSGGKKTAPDLIKEADKELYIVKNIRHKITRII